MIVFYSVMFDVMDEQRAVDVFVVHFDKNSGIVSSNMLVVKLMKRIRKLTVRWFG